MFKTYTQANILEDQLGDIVLDNLMTTQEPSIELIVNDSIMSDFLVQVAETQGVKLTLQESLDTLIDYVVNALTNDCDRHIILPDLNNWLIIDPQEGLGEHQEAKIKLLLSTIAVELYDNQRDNTVSIILPANIANLLETAVIPSMYSVE